MSSIFFHRWLSTNSPSPEPLFAASEVKTVAARGISSHCETGPRLWSHLPEWFPTECPAIWTQDLFTWKFLWTEGKKPLPDKMCSDHLVTAVCIFKCNQTIFFGKWKLNNFKMCSCVFYVLLKLPLGFYFLSTSWFGCTCFNNLLGNWLMFSIILKLSWAMFLHLFLYA